VIFACFMITHSLSRRPVEALLGGATIAAGVVLYVVVKRFR
jgi:hypothetical protein